MTYLTRPLLPFDAPEDATHPDLVWQSILDDRFLVEVHRLSSHNGTLHIFDHNKNDEEIFSHPVELAYGAMFGPDSGDVLAWQGIVLDFIDNSYVV